MRNRVQKVINNKKLRGIIWNIVIIAILAGIILPPVLAIFSVFVN